jgi:hypothetical protein
MIGCFTFVISFLSLSIHIPQAYYNWYQTRAKGCPKMNEDGLRFFRPTLSNLDEIAALEAAGE